MSGTKRMKLLINKIILISFILVANFSFAQSNIEGNVIKIISFNSFEIIADNKIFEVVLNDTSTTGNENQNKLAKEYLNKNILGKSVVVTVMYENNNKLYASVLYNCKHLQNIKYNQNDIQCSEGNVLDIEMIKLGLIKYIGKNDFLKSLFNKD